MLASTLWLPDFRRATLFDPNNSRLLEDLGLIHKAAAGRFSLLPLGALILERMNDVYRVHMQRSGAVEVIFLTMSPADIWRESGRWDGFGPALVKTVLNSGGDVCFNPTHEEAAVSIMKRRLKSYRELPVNMFCIQKVYRDELRPKSELLRTQEFYMADSYSFHTDGEDAERGYRQMQTVFANILREFEVPFRVVDADNGLIGGSKSVEFQFEHALGESIFFSCRCGYASDADVQLTDALCINCGDPMSVNKGIEMAHVFLLETTYSAQMKLRFRDRDNALIPPQMGCTGIGMTRVLHTLLLHHMHETGIAWPSAIAPFDVILIPWDTADDRMHYLMDRLEARSVSCLLDDRPLRNSAKQALVEFLNPQFVISELASRKGCVLYTQGQDDGEMLGTVELEQRVCDSLNDTRAERIATAKCNNGSVVA